MRSLLLSFGLLALTACGGGSTDAAATGTLQISVTDAPLDPALVAAAELTVERVRVHRSSEDDVESGWITLFEDDPVTLPLSDLRNGLTALLARADLPVGSYRQARLHLTGGALELTNGNLYTTGAGTLNMPSSMSSAGFKVHFESPVVIEQGETQNVLLDFDLARTFKAVPANDPPNASQFHLTPHVRAAVLYGTGELSATVRRDDGLGGLDLVEDAFVYVLEPGEQDVEAAVASSITDATGTAVVMALDPVGYDVLAVQGEDSVRLDGVLVFPDTTTAVDLVLP